MAKTDEIKIFIEEIYSKPPKRSYLTNKIIYNHIDENWSIDLADMVDYKTSIIKGYRNVFLSIDNMSMYLWAKPLKNKIVKQKRMISQKLDHHQNDLLLKWKAIGDQNFIIVSFRTS